MSSDGNLSIRSESISPSNDITARLDEIIALMKTGSATPNHPPTPVTNASSDSISTDISTDSKALLTQRTPLTTQSYIKIRTIGQQLPILRSCQCDCHSVSRMKTSGKIDTLFGLLFIGYSGSLSRWSSCKRCPCPKNADRTANFTYYFPKWFMARVIYIVGSWNSMDGPNIALRMMRIIPDDSLIFHYAGRGMISEMQSLFQDRLASPFDVSSKTGRSALHVGFLNWQGSESRLTVGVVCGGLFTRRSMLLLAAAGGRSSLRRQVLPVRISCHIVYIIITMP
jgi:hypothetical protein